jgi:hypothetical protein
MPRFATSYDQLESLPMANKKRNALKHGANASEVMLWGEKYKDYEALRDGLYQEFSPSGSTEEYLVRTLLDLRWRRWRLEYHEQIVIRQRLDRVREENEYSHHVDNLRSFAPAFGKATSEEQVEAVLATLSPIYRNTIRRDWPFKTGDDPQKWGAKIAAGLLACKPAPRYEQAEEYIKIVDLDEFDTALDRIERLDAMIDRTIKRLMQLKTMKQMHGQLEPKPIDVSAAKHLPAPGKTESPSNE